MVLRILHCHINYEHDELSFQNKAYHTSISHRNLEEFPFYNKQLELSGKMFKLVSVFLRRSGAEHDHVTVESRTSLDFHT